MGLLTQAIVEYAAQVPTASEDVVKKFEHLLENRLYVTGEILKKMKLLLKNGR